MCRNNNRVRPFCLLFYLYHSHTLKRAKIKWEENIRKTKWTKPTGISFQCFWRLRAGAAAIAHGILPLVICILRYRKPSIVIRNVKYERCLHFEGGIAPNISQLFLFCFVLLCFKMKNLVFPLKRLRFPVGNDIGIIIHLKRRAAVDCCCYFPYIPSRLSRWSFKLMESIKYQEAHACFSVRLGFQPTPTHSPHLPVYTKAVSLSHLGNWWYPMCTLGGSRTARSVFFSWPIALWRPPYSFWLFFYNRKIQWCPFVFVCQAVLSGICLALEELGSALLPRWNNNTNVIVYSSSANLERRGSLLLLFGQRSFLASCRRRRIRESKEKSKFSNISIAK